MFQLQDLRDSKKLRWPMGILFAIVIISFVFFYGWRTDTFQGGGERPFARVKAVNGGVTADWINFYSPDLMAAGERLQGRIVSMLPEVYQQVLQQVNLAELISAEDAAREAANRVILMEKANQEGIHVPIETVHQIFRSQPNLTDSVLDEIARRQGFGDKHGYAEFIRRNLEMDRVRFLEGVVAHASLFELWQEYSLANEQIELQMAAYPATEYEDEVVVTEEDLADYLTENRERYRLPDQRRYAYVRLSKVDLSDQIEPTDEELQAYYEQHQADYAYDAGVRADELLLPLADETMTTRALQVLEEVRPEAAASDDWTSLSQQLTARYADMTFYNRTTPWVEREAAIRPPEEVRMLFALEDDQVSTPSLIQNMALLARVIERREPGVPPLSEIREQVLLDYKTAKADELFEEKADEWRDQIDQFEDIQAFAQAVGVEDKLTSPVAAEAFVIPEIGTLYRDRDYLYMLDEDRLSDVIKTDQFLVVLQIRETIPAHDPPLAEIRDKVEADYRREEAIEVARAEAEQNLSLIEGGADFQTTLNDAPKPPFTTDPVTRTEPIQDLQAPLIDFTQQTLDIEVGSTGITPYGNNPDRPDGYAIWKVLSLEQPSREDFRTERYSLQRDYEQLQRLAIVEEWLADARREAQFEILAP